MRGGLTLTVCGLTVTESGTKKKTLIQCSEIDTITEYGEIRLKDNKVYHFDRMSNFSNETCQKIMSLVDYVKKDDFCLRDCYYKENDKLWVFADKIVHSNDKGAVRHIFLSDISNLRIKKAMLLVQYIEFDGKVVKSDGTYGTNRKNDLNISPSKVDEFLKIVIALQKHENILPKSKELVLSIHV